ncbi:MAG: hypothetical protein H0X39_17380 [Actinobacteria bacterium]|nr:hypothetical protein [Actinomycetota bacterium]
MGDISELVNAGYPGAAAIAVLEAGHTVDLALSALACARAAGFLDGGADARQALYLLAVPLPRSETP